MPNALQVNDQLSHKDLFDAFKMQLAKDFEQSNFQTDFIKNLSSDYTGICEKIAGELQHSGKTTDANLMPLLNRIDISETQLKKYLSEYSHENYLMTIAELIVKRVLQKIVIRQYYKRNENQQDF